MTLSWGSSSARAAGTLPVDTRTKSRVAALQSGQEQSVIDGGLGLVRLLALVGDEATCRAEAARHLRASQDRELSQVRVGLATALALLELSLGNAAAAHAQLEPILALLEPLGAEPTILRPTIPLTVEALVGLGRIAEAEAMLAPYAELAHRRGRAASIADAAMCRALVLAARADVDAAVESAADAVASFESLEDPFDAARASLVHGEILRRARKKAAAHDAVAKSLAAFERLGAARWADRARAELGRSQSRRAGGGPLTETQRRVAELAAAGQTNREIADALFMSVHTVEAHLTQVYRALDVHTRTELARLLVDRPNT